MTLNVKKVITRENLGLLISLLTLASAIYIGLSQLEINRELKELSTFELLEPSLGAKFDENTKILTLTNHGKSAIYIDSERLNIDSYVIPVQKNLFPGESIEFNQQDNLERSGTPFSPIVFYEIFFKVIAIDNAIYSGFITLRAPGAQINPVNEPTVSITKLKETSFIEVDQSISETKKH